MKVKKTYRLNQLTVDQIQEIRNHYKERGLDLTDSQVIQKAVDTLRYNIYQKIISETQNQIIVENEKE